MLKELLVCCLTLIGINEPISAQTNLDIKGKHLINLGFGAYSPFAYNYAGLPPNNLLPSLHLSAEFVKAERADFLLSYGLGLAYQRTEIRKDSVDLLSNGYFITMRSAAHFIHGQLDWYLSLQFGAFFRHNQTSTVNFQRQYPVFGAFGSGLVGLRYFLSNHFGLFAELGYDTSLIKAGCCFRL